MDLTKLILLGIGAYVLLSWKPKAQGWNEQGLPVVWSTGSGVITGDLNLPYAQEYWRQEGGFQIHYRNGVEVDRTRIQDLPEYMGQ